MTSSRVELPPPYAGDVILIAFPYTDLTSFKRRPAVVVSANDYPKRAGDILLMGLTGKQQPDSPEISDLNSAGLVKPTWVKLHITTIELTRMTRRMGSLSNADRQAVQEAVGKLLHPDFIPQPVAV